MIISFSIGAVTGTPATLAEDGNYSTILDGAEDGVHWYSQDFQITDPELNEVVVPIAVPEGMSANIQVRKNGERIDARKITQTDGFQDELFTLQVDPAAVYQLQVRIWDGLGEVLFSDAILGQLEPPPDPDGGTDLPVPPPRPMSVAFNWTGHKIGRDIFLTQYEEADPLPQLIDEDQVSYIVRGWQVGRDLILQIEYGYWEGDTDA